MARRGGPTKPLFVWEIGSAVPLEERFGGLFRAARALLREEAHEDKVLPTLALEGLDSAALTGGGQKSWRTPEQEAERKRQFKVLSVSWG